MWFRSNKMRLSPNPSNAPLCYGYPVPDKPNVDFNAPELNAVNVSQDLREFNLKSLEWNYIENLHKSH